jgi:hypothetical protein
MNWDWKEWAKAALIRAVKTFAQTFASCIAVGATMAEVDWLRALSVSGVAFVLSIATSLGGLPEVKRTDPPDQISENK